ncbi:MAG: mechanosensitive ion channel [Puia sp.]|nr:mechanosensitive ion channel [Puia sp.]
MHDFWNQVIFSNPLKKYLIVVSTILLVVILKRYLSLLIAGFLFRIVRRVSAGVDQPSFVSLIKGPIQTFLVVFISASSIEKLHFPEELDFDIYEVSSRTIVRAIAIIIIIIGFIWLLLRTIDFIALILQRKANAAGDLRDNQLVVFFRDFMKVILGIIGIMMILSMAFGWQINSLLGSLGIAGAALALAAKESIENLIASFIIFFDKPFTAGDVLNVNNISGTVERIGLRSTRIRTDQKTYVTVPNKQMVDSIVDNLTLRTQRKAEIRLQVSLSTPSANLDRFVEAVRLILKKDRIQSSSVFLNDISATAFLVNVDYFTAPVSQAEFNDIKQQVNLEILRLMERLSIEIAGASSDVRLTGNPPPQTN